MLVQQILASKANQNVATIQKSATLGEAAALLAKHRIGALIVSKDGKQVEGILSERDVVRELGSRGTVCMEDKVADVMTSKVKSCRLDQSAVSVLEQMTAGRFRHMPVLDDAGIMIGVISIGDVVKARIEEVEHENQALTGMIAGF